MEGHNSNLLLKIVRLCHFNRPYQHIQEKRSPSSQLNNKQERKILLSEPKSCSKYGH